jgi:hypothetical protein
VYDTLDYTGGLTTGRYYIKVAPGPNFIGTDQDYIVVVAELAAGDPAPAKQTQGSYPPSDASEPDGANPWGGGSSETIALDEVVARKLANGTDSDWFTLDLP